MGTGNVPQESLMWGGLSGISSTGRKVTTKAVKSVTGDLLNNQGSWRLAEEMSKLICMTEREAVLRCSLFLSVMAYSLAD
jgi:hypothetical protein